MANKLAEMARIAPTAAWMIGSYSEDSKGRQHPLISSTGYCCAWAAECLAHAFQPERGPNRRHGQRNFTYVYGSADAWGRALRAGGDCDKGAWLDGDQRDNLLPGDMIFWMQGVNGYKYANGHVATVVLAGAGIVSVSENSSSRGIGTHRISRGSLANMGGLMRWWIDEPPRALLVQMADSEAHCAFRMEGSRAVCDVRDLAEMLGYEVRAEHLQAEGKIYLVRRG